MMFGINFKDVRKVDWRTKEGKHFDTKRWADGDSILFDDGLEIRDVESKCTAI